MEIASVEWNRLIEEGAAGLGISISEVAMEGFGRHASELKIWNQRMNLTRIVEPVELAVRHILDSLALVPHIPQDAWIVDIGSGGGFPGIPIKLARSDTHLTMVESIGKKVSFLKHMIRFLELEETEVLQIRAESAEDKPHLKHQFDVAICRALADLKQCYRLAIPFLKPDGILLALKGAKAKEEIQDFEAALAQEKKRVLNVLAKDIQVSAIPYRLPFMETEMAVVRVSTRSQ
jgi:16S rRNA (guanine527-N7)-methyltransferase